MARWDGQEGALALELCPGMPRAGTSSGCGQGGIHTSGWDSHVRVG